MLELPRRAYVQVSRRKVTDYLLATRHPVGAPKATYFESRGYTIEDPEVFENALYEVAQTGQVLTAEVTPWGTKYFVVGDVGAPDGNSMTLGTVSIVADGGVPMLVTAFPTRR